MTLDEAKIILINRGFVKVNGYQMFDGVKWRNAIAVISKWLEQEPCDDCISRQAVIEIAVETGAWETQSRVMDLPSVTPQESSLTWVTGADGAKIAFWDVPVWKVTKICEILGEPQESEDIDGNS